LRRFALLALFALSCRADSIRNAPAAARPVDIPAGDYSFRVAETAPEPEGIPRRPGRRGRPVPVWPAPVAYVPEPAPWILLGVLILATCFWLLARRLFRR
jgi:hypothetical protein